jgi:endonuclease/exonuclease/phosphatase family metal-dependent hydrolase
LILIAVAVFLYNRYRDQLRPYLDVGGEVVPDKGHGLRVVTWNLRNFEGEASDHDLDLLRTRIESLDPDVLAVQEIRDPEAFTRVVTDWGPHWKTALSKGGGKGHQRLGIVYDARRVELRGAPREHRSMTLGGRVRPAHSTYLRAREDGLDFHLVVVHLKARPSGYEMRREQWGLLGAVLRELEPRADRDVIVLGDFNTTGPENGLPDSELVALDEALGASDLRRVDNPQRCSAYWDGARRDAWKEPSMLDLVFVRGFENSLPAQAQLTPGAHCAAHSCEVFRSTKSYPDPDFGGISDHCPMVLDFGSSSAAIGG